MLVIADSSPFIALINIGHLDVLPALFGQVTIPPAVAGDLLMANKPLAVQEFAAARPAWLSIRRPNRVEPIPKLHPGESEAISLAQELHADLILIDERRAFRAASPADWPRPARCECSYGPRSGICLTWGAHLPRSRRRISG